MECCICHLSNYETDLFDGIYRSEISKVCAKCAEIENIILIKKPTSNQLIAADRRFSVKERLEKLSSGKVKSLSGDQEVANKNLSKLKMPKKKQESEKLVDNYDWEIRMARRRLKMTVDQLSESIGVSVNAIEFLEKGQIPEDLEKVIYKMEMFFEIKLFKNREKIIHFKMPKEGDAEKIIEDVKKRMENSDMQGEFDDEDEFVEVDKKKKEILMEKISNGEIDFSKRKNLKDITLNDLVEAKRNKERKNFLDDDLEIDE